MEACRIIGLDVSQLVSGFEFIWMRVRDFRQNNVKSPNNKVRIYLIEITQHRGKDNYWLLAH